MIRAAAGQLHPGPPQRAVPRTQPPEAARTQPTER